MTDTPYDTAALGSRVEQKWTRGSGTRLTTAERFWAQVRRGEQSECWPFAGFLTTQGYGKFNIAPRRPRQAHRVAWELTHGAVGKDACVSRTCDSRACCNPTHLVLIAKRLPPEVRFAAKVKQSNGCWVWTAATARFGYGTFNAQDGVMVPAHRFAWTQAHGDIPAGMFVLHRCDNPKCVRPDHLFLGTQSENMQDMHQKGRGWRGGSRRKVS